MYKFLLIAFLTLTLTLTVALTVAAAAAGDLYKVSIACFMTVT
jgi:hypothetical protein